MKVKQLIKKLEKANPEADVILSSDMEGNRFGLANEIEYQNFIRYVNNENEIEICEADDDAEGAKPCVIIWPNM